MRRAKITPFPAGYAEDSNESKTDKKMNATNSEINTQKGGQRGRERGGKHSITIKQGMKYTDTVGGIARG